MQIEVSSRAGEVLSAGTVIPLEGVLHVVVTDPSLPVLVSCGCWKKRPQTSWLRN